MKVIIDFIDWDVRLKITVPSRPNKGDGIYVEQFKSVKNISCDELIKELNDSSRCKVVDVVLHKVYSRFLFFKVKTFMWKIGVRVIP